MNPVPHLIGRTAPLLNRYLALDPEGLKGIAALSGKCICFDVTQPEIRIYCLPDAQGVSLETRQEGSPDCTIRGTAIALLNLTRSENPTAAISRGEVQIEGDSRLAQQFSDALGAIEIDWEELLSQYTGDLLAHKTGTVFKKLLGWFGDSRDALRDNTADYLKEEARVLPTRIEIEAFQDEIDQLRTDTDRLEARLRQQEKLKKVTSA